MLRKSLCYKALMCLSLSAPLVAFAAGEAVVESAGFEAVHAAAPMKTSAVIFSKKSPNLTVKKAYTLQKAFVKNSVAKGVDIVGYKSGLTSLEASRALGLEHPISGVLLQAPLRGQQAQISMASVSGLHLEQEFAFQISKPVNEKITAGQLHEYIAGIAPAIEIPQMNFASKDFNGLDVIANNALAYKVMIGEWQSPALLKSLDAVPVTLSCNGKVLAEGKGSNALGGQSAALLWLINHILDQGYKIQKGQVLISGALFKPVAVTSCVYEAAFGKLGKLELSVTP